MMTNFPCNNYMDACGLQTYSKIEFHFISQAGYYFVPNVMSSLQAQQNAAVAAASAQGLYGMADNWSHLHL